jgi:lysophospholipase L1-like esterase
MKKLRDTSKSVKELSKKSRKYSRLTISLAVLPVIIAAAAVSVMVLLPAGALNKSAPDKSVKNANFSNDISLPLNAPVPESQEISRQIAEQKETEKQRLEQERILARAKELAVKQAREDARIKICFIGDSITQGGVYGEVGAAEKAINILNAGSTEDPPPYDGINLGIGGSTADKWVSTINSDLIKHCHKKNMRVVMIMLGTNDAEGGVSSENYLANMFRIVAAANNLGASVIVNCPIQLGLGKNQHLISEYCAGLPANGVSTPLSVPLSWDDIHPTSGGYSALASAWADIIRYWANI